jgi:SAM-dependent methyltransferase
VRAFWTQVTAGFSRILPYGLKCLWRRHRLERMRRHNRGRGVAEIFSEIYSDNRWGGVQGLFHSGSGSTPEHADLYARVVKRLIQERGVRHIVDLGCGDFRVGAQLIEGTGVMYTGIDIVATLIEDNRRRYGSDQVHFECRNIIEDELPEGDLCLIRQVLQHLSNQQISRVLKNVARYRCVIVTEHYPAPGALHRKNLDKPCGEDVRIYDGSGVFLDAAPFNQQVSGPLLDVDAGHCLIQPGERIRTYLIENPPLQAAVANPA